MMRFYGRCHVRSFGHIFHERNFHEICRLKVSFKGINARIKAWFNGSRFTVQRLMVFRAPPETL
jgi:hypothetical protein